MRIKAIIDRFSSFVSVSYWKLFRKNAITIEWDLLMTGIAIIDISENGKLTIGKNVFLNSRNRRYHLNMHSPVKLMADRAGQITIGDNTRIHGTCIHAYSKISIGSNCLIAANTQIIDGNGHELSFHDPANRMNTFGTPKDVIIEDNVWIGANCIILPGSKIGSGSVISAGSLVFGEIPQKVLAGGNPIKIIKSFDL
jgi:carbonic anhydrase/acetyltransferase-like protein (isoleucine patch superfamily)